VSAPPQAFSLSVDDLKGKSLDEVVGRMVPALNAYLRNGAVRGEGLSGQNFNEDRRSFDVTIPASYPLGDFPLKVDVRLVTGTRPVAVLVASAHELDTNGKPKLNDADTVPAFSVDWVPVSAERIKIRSLPGLTASRRYRVAVIIRGE